MVGIPLFSAILPSMRADGTTGTVARIASEFHVEWPLLIAQIINFLVVAFLLHRFALKPLLETLSQRSVRIADGLQYAEEMKTQLAKTEVLRSRELKEASRKAALIVDEAQRTATDLAATKRAELALHLSRTRRQAQDRLRQDREVMVDEAQRHLREEVVNLAGALLKSELSPELRDQVAQRMLQRLTTGEKLG